jgi:hypothetical protein
VLNAAGSGDASSIIAALSWLLETSLDGSSPNPGGVTNAQQLSVDVVNLALLVNLVILSQLFCV